VEGKFIPAYISKQIIQVSPFESLDEEGVGRLIALACKEGRAPVRTWSWGSAASTAGTRTR